jgi:hypothetical protein
MSLIAYCIQQPLVFPLRAIEGFLSHFMFIKKLALGFIMIFSILNLNRRPTKSEFQLGTLAENKTLKNRDKGTISKSDTSFCALFQPILPKKRGRIPLDPSGGASPNIKVR